VPRCDVGGGGGGVHKCMWRSKWLKGAKKVQKCKMEKKRVSEDGVLHYYWLWAEICHGEGI